MANSNPARHRHHARETYRSNDAARRRAQQVTAAGFRAYTVDMGPAARRRERYAVIITEGKRGDLRTMPPR